MKTKILFVAHCVLNTGSKVVMYDAEEMAAEEALRRKVVHAATDGGVMLVQLPCPELTLYGSRRWGHTSDQFDNPFFRRHCRRLLEGPLDEMAEYLQNPDRFEVLGVLGIDGSPSCGVKYTCTGPWGGNLGGRSDLPQVIADAKLAEGRGVFMQELAAMLRERGLNVPMDGLFAEQPGRAMGLLGL